jgi:hypothetical protein
MIYVVVAMVQVMVFVIIICNDNKVRRKINKLEEKLKELKK